MAGVVRSPRIAGLTVEDVEDLLDHVHREFGLGFGRDPAMCGVSTVRGRSGSSRSAGRGRREHVDCRAGDRSFSERGCDASRSTTLAAAALTIRRPASFARAPRRR